MAGTPRYLGTTAAEALAALEAMLTTQVFLREFDMDGDGSVAADSPDGVAVVAGVCAAERMVDVKLKASHGTPFTGPLPATILDLVAMLTPWCTMRWRGFAVDEKAPGRLLYTDAKDLLKDLASDTQARLPETGAPSPTNALPMVYAARPFWGGGHDDGCGD